jgi:hypothetical protein
MATSEKLQRRNFEEPDDKRKPGRGTANVVNVGEFGLMHVTLSPGWRWSEDVKPTTHTDSCQARHVIHMQSGRMHVVMEDGSETLFGPGDVGLISPGHDAWVVGDEPAVYLDITGSGVWAKPT